MELPKIAIIGGGPSGLTLARLLQNDQIPCTLFELDASRSVRPAALQGSLDLHTATGQEALRQAGLLDRFNELSRPEGEAFKMIEPKTLSTIFSKDPPPPGEPNKPEIMRTDLREMLLDSLLPDSIKWGKKLVEVKPAKAATYDLYFQDGSVEKGFDLVVGADGAWSRVRPLVSSELPHYVGIVWVSFDTPKEHIRQDISDLIGEGAIMAATDQKAIWLQRMTGGYINGYLSMRAPETWIDDAGIDFSDGDGAREIVAERYLKNWSDTLRHVVLGSKGAVLARRCYQLPVGFKWDHRPGVTLTGDAAHVMPPYAGIGANISMEDSLELARSIIKRKHHGKKAIAVDAVREYEQSMFPRSEHAASLTEHNMKLCFDGAEGKLYI